MSRLPRRAVLLLLAVALLAPAPARARRAEPPPAPTDTLRLSLDDAVQRAQSHSEEMRTARANVKQTGGQVLQAVSQALPQISGSVVYNRKIESIYDGFSTTSSSTSSDSSSGGDDGMGNLIKMFASKNTWTTTLSAQQLLWSGGKVGSALRTARAANRAALANERETAAEVRFQVRQAYYDAVYARRLVEIAESALDQARAHLAQVRAGRREGTRSEYELLRAEVDAANQEPGVIAARNGLDLAMLAVKRLVDMPLGQPLALVSPLLAADGTVPVVTDLSTVVDQRPAVAAANQMVEARRLAVNLYRSQYWPSLYASSSVSHVAYPSDVWPRRREFWRSWDAYVTLSVPIFNGLFTHGQVVEAKAEYEKARASRDLAVKGAAIEAEQARDEIERAQTTLLARRETVRQAQRAWELAGVRFTNGMSTQVEVSDARLQLKSSEVNEVQALRDYLVAIAQLERAVGRPLSVEPRPLEQLAPVSNPEGTH
jgi:outer membrane protein